MRFYFAAGNTTTMINISFSFFILKNENDFRSPKLTSCEYCDKYRYYITTIYLGNKKKRILKDKQKKKSR